MNVEFNRFELKFVVEASVGAELFDALREHLVVDKHGDSLGRYELTSLYFDTTNFRFFRDRNESVGYRRKVRLRQYGNGAIFLEIKERHKSVIRKKRVKLNDLDDTLSALSGDDHVSISDVLALTPDGDVRREVSYLNSVLGLHPTSIIRYTRRSYQGRFDDRLRITLDTALTVGGNSLSNRGRERFFLRPDLAILEVKADRAIPVWLRDALTKRGLSRTRYSKYCEALLALSDTPEFESLLREERHYITAELPTAANS